jgi:hypothetical protein
VRIAQLFLLAPLGLLVACQRPGDTQPPLIGITYPKTGILSAKSLRVEGNVLDDNGIASIVAMNKELVTPANKGQKMIPFAFQLKALKSGKVSLKVTATDINGQTRTLRMPLQLDAKPPEISIVSVTSSTKILEAEKITKKEDGTEETTPAKTETVLQISGKVVDNTRVESVTVVTAGKYRPLSLPKKAEVQFFDEVPQGSISVIAVDAAGNKTSLRVR